MSDSCHGCLPPLLDRNVSSRFPFRNRSGYVRLVRTFSSLASSIMNTGADVKNIAVAEHSRSLQRVTLDREDLQIPVVAYRVNLVDSEFPLPCFYLIIRPIYCLNGCRMRNQFNIKNFVKLVFPHTCLSRSIAR